MPNESEFQKPEVLEQAKKDLTILRGEEKHLQRIRIFKNAIEGNLTAIPEWEKRGYYHETHYETGLCSWQQIRLRLIPGPSFAIKNFKLESKALIARVRLDILDGKLSEEEKEKLADATIAYLKRQKMDGKYFPNPGDDGEENREGGVLHMWYQHPNGYMRSDEKEELESQGRLIIPTDDMLQTFLPVLQRATESIEKVKKSSEESYFEYFEEPANVS
jgi:hypothetical protein